jgi:hypothetical protein
MSPYVKLKICEMHHNMPLAVCGLPRGVPLPAATINLQNYNQVQAY